ncbi:MAG TPA: DegV family protein [Dictyoglomaceae bacterium]|nr:DegV family protein [Dictyoglomaceae bacterium]
MAKEAEFSVVTDTTSDLSKDILKEFDINVISYYVYVNGDSYQEKIDIEPEDIWKSMEEAQDGKYPKTACPGVGEYYEAFKKILATGKSVLSIHMTSWGSGAFQSANTAKNILKEENPNYEIEVYDSKSVTLGTGFLAIEAAKAALKGWNVSQTLQQIKKIRENLFHAFTNDTLKYLAAGGRIGKAKYLLAEVFNINPIISIDNNGVIYALDKERGRTKAYQKIASHTYDFFKNKFPINIGFVHANAIEEVSKLKEEVLKRFNVKEILSEKLGAALSVHAGPGTVGLVAYPSELSTY